MPNRASGVLFKPPHVLFVQCTGGRSPYPVDSGWHWTDRRHLWPGSIVVKYTPFAVKAGQANFIDRLYGLSPQIMLLSSPLTRHAVWGERKSDPIHSSVVDHWGTRSGTILQASRPPLATVVFLCAWIQIVMLHRPNLDLVPQNSVKHNTLQAACCAVVHPAAQLHWLQPLYMILAPLVRLLFCSNDYTWEEETACT